MRLVAGSPPNKAPPTLNRRFSPAGSRRLDGPPSANYERMVPVVSMALTQALTVRPERPRPLIGNEDVGGTQ